MEYGNQQSVSSSWNRSGMVGNWIMMRSTRIIERRPISLMMWEDLKSAVDRNETCRSSGLG